MKQTAQQGFSLTELLIAMAIMSILTMIAVPSYQEHLQKSRIAMAKADLMELAGFLERQRTVNACYNGTACDQTATQLIANQSSPILDMLSDDTAQYYDVTLTALTNSTFTLRATPDTVPARMVLVIWRCCIPVNNAGIKIMTVIPQILVKETGSASNKQTGFRFCETLFVSD